MRKLAVLILCMIACNPDNDKIMKSKREQHDKYLNDNLICSFVEKYNTCFCSFNLGWQDGALTWVPKEVCGR